MADEEKKDLGGFNWGKKKKEKNEEKSEESKVMIDPVETSLNEVHPQPETKIMVEPPVVIPPKTIKPMSKATSLHPIAFSKHQAVMSEKPFAARKYYKSK